MGSSTENELRKKILDENRRVHALENKLYLKRHPEQTNWWQTQLLNRTLDDYCRRLGKPDARILDVGCGVGYLYLPLLLRGYDMTGVDLSQEMIRVLQEVVPPELQMRSHLIVQDIVEFIQHEATVFDGAVLSALLHHLYEFETALRAICKRVAPGGPLLIFFEPLKQNIESPAFYAWHKRLARLDEALYRKEMRFRRIDVLEYEYEYSDYQRRFGGIEPDRLENVMKKAGMVILNVTRYCARRHGLAAWAANTFLKTANTFNLLAIKEG